MGRVKGTNDARTEEDAGMLGEPEEDADGAGEHRSDHAENDEWTLEEAGYGYGV